MCQRYCGFITLFELFQIHTIKVCVPDTIKNSFSIWNYFLLYFKIEFLQLCIDFFFLLGRLYLKNNFFNSIDIQALELTLYIPIYNLPRIQKKKNQLLELGKDKKKYFQLQRIIMLIYFWFSQLQLLRALHSLLMLQSSRKHT